MRGGKRPRPGSNKGHNSQPFFKKRKRSKKYWQQRKTAEHIAAPVDEEVESSDEDDGDEIVESSYDTFLNTFAQESKIKVQSDDDEDDSEDDENGHDKSENSEDDESQDNAEKTVEKDTENSDDSNDESVEEEEEVENDKKSSGDEEDDDEENEDQDVMADFNESDQETEDFVDGDPFVTKTELEIPDKLKETIENKDSKDKVITWKALGRFSVQVPSFKYEKLAKGKKKLLLDDSENDLDEKLWKLQENQNRLIHQSFSEPTKSLDQHQLKNQIESNVQQLSAFQNEFLTLLNSYKDLYFCEETFENLEEIRQAYTIHVLNHMLKTRSKILKNNEKLSKNPKAPNVRDQGLVRPKIVIVVPFKESARRIVHQMGKLLFQKFKGGCIANKKRFDEDFGTEITDLDQIKESGKKPPDYYDTFCGNSDDGFKIGVAVTKKTLKLYTDFYSSDIIIASPLGLRMVIGVEGEAKRDHDFLASIEMIIFDQMDIMAMQNWDHVTHILEHLHMQPAKSHGVDFSRVRMWSLNGLSKFYRQTLMLSSIPMPEIRAILNKNCFNFAGKILSSNPYEIGAISSIVSTVPVVFHRFDTNSAARAVDDRFEYFVSKVMPDFKKDMMYHTMIFVPSYFDYVRVRNWCQSSDLDFAEICEYTKDKKMAMARDLFYHSEKHFLIYTERAHFFRRFSIKGIRHLIFYQLPMYPKFFAEICNFMQSTFQNRKGGSDGNMSCTVIYNKYDYQRLAPAVTTDRAQTMLRSEKTIHMFAPGKS